MIRHLLPLLALSACGLKSVVIEDTSKPSDSGKDTATDSADTADTRDTTDTHDSHDTTDTGKETGDTHDTTETGDTGKETGDTSEPPVYDCSKLPDFNLGDTTMDDPRAYHGLSFDDDGYLIGWDGRRSVMKSPYKGAAEPWIPGLTGIEGMDRLPDGDWVVANASTAQLLRISPDGGAETIVSGLAGVYGVTIGPDGMIYAANGGLVRVDPETGETTELLPNPMTWTMHVVDFNLDSTRLYIGTIGSGDVYYVDLDEDLNPTVKPILYARVGSGWHDGVGVDVCGNVYVTDYYTAGLYRINTDGTVVPMIKPGFGRFYGHGLQWGSGIGGWRTDTLYQPQPYNGSTVREVVIGYESAETIRTWKSKSKKKETTP